MTKNTNLIKLFFPDINQNQYDIEGYKHHGNTVIVFIREKNLVPSEIRTINKNLEILGIKSKGFYEGIDIQDHSIQGKKAILRVYKRRWEISFKNPFGQILKVIIPSKIKFKANHMKITKRFASFLKSKIEAYVTEITRIALLFSLNSKTLSRYYQKHMTDMEQVAAVNMVFPENFGKRIAIDEVALHRGDYWTIFSNRDSGKVFAIIKGTKFAVLEDELKKHFTITQLFSVTEVTSDMANQFDWLVRIVFPNAEHIIDRFHVQQYVHEGVQEERIKLKNKEVQVLENERKAFSRKNNNKNKKFKPFTYENGDTKPQLLTRCRKFLFKHEKDWSEQQLKRAGILFREYPRLREAYDLQEEFRKIYDSDILIKQAAILFDSWGTKVEKSSFKGLKRAWKTFSNHKGKILNYFNNRRTNALAERINGTIKLFKTLVRGMKVPEFFIFRLSTYIA